MKDIRIQMSSEDTIINTFFWSNNTMLDTELGDKLNAYYNNDLCVSAVLYTEKTFVSIVLYVYKLKHLKKAIEEINKYIFLKYPNSYKVSTTIVEKDYFGMHFLKKSNYQIEACLRQHCRIKGQLHNVYLMACYREGIDHI